MYPLRPSAATTMALLLISCSIAAPDEKAPQEDNFAPRREICREYFSRNVSAPHLDTSVIEEICRRPLLLVHGFHGSGTSWVASMLQRNYRRDLSAASTIPSDNHRNWEVIGFSPPGCQKHIGRGWDPARTPRSCTGAPMDEGELLQNLWPQFTRRLSDPAKWCPSCITSAPAPLLHVSSASNLSCIYLCPDLEPNFSSQSSETASKWAAFWKRSHFFGDCNYCQGTDGTNDRATKEASACSCQTIAGRAPPNSSISPVEVVFGEWSYFWGHRKAPSNDRNVVLMSKTPDLSPGLMLRLLPGATMVLGIIRHPYFIMRCGLGNLRDGVAARSSFYAREAQGCVELWSRTLKAFRSRLDSDHFHSPYALVRYEDAVGQGAEHWFASCVLDNLLREEESAEMPRRALWGLHGEGDASTTGGSSPWNNWKHKDSTFSHRNVCPSDRNGACVGYLRAAESDIANEYGYRLLVNSSASWSQWPLQPRLLRSVLRGTPTPTGSPLSAAIMLERVACPRRGPSSSPPRGF